MGLEPDHTPPYSAEDKNGGAIPPLLNTSSWHDAYLIQHKDNFTSAITGTSIEMAVTTIILPSFCIIFLPFLSS
jgi:hypothetical protein